MNNIKMKINLKKCICAVICIIIIINGQYVGQCIYDNILKYNCDIENLNLPNSTTFEVLVVDGKNSSDIVQINNKEQSELVNLLNSLNLIDKKSRIMNSDHNKYAYIYCSGGDIDTIGIAGNNLMIWLRDSDESVFNRYYILDSGYNFITDTNKIYRYLKKIAF